MICQEEIFNKKINNNGIKYTNSASRKHGVCCRKLDNGQVLTKGNLLMVSIVL
jgi:hypothetical protein